MSLDIYEDRIINSDLQRDSTLRKTKVNPLTKNNETGFVRRIYNQVNKVKASVLASNKESSLKELELLSRVIQARLVEIESDIGTNKQEICLIDKQKYLTSDIEEATLIEYCEKR